MTAASANPPARVLLASLIGTTIEFFDFYIYGTAAVLVFPKLFFPSSEPAAATLQSLATFALAFFARPVGSAVFGHYGDRIGRKATLVAALLTMGLSTVLIGLLPTYASIGVLAPLLLALCRFGQGFGLGGEWGGAVLLATENSPPGKRNWYGSFPQYGAPIGFIISSGIFLLLTRYLSESQFLQWGWRVPFVASSVLVIVGLWIRLRIEETRDFRIALQNRERVAVPLAEVFRSHAMTVLLGTLGSVAIFALFYLLTVFALGWATSTLGYSRQEFLVLQIIGMVFFGAGIPVSAMLADRFNPRVVMMVVAAAHRDLWPGVRATAGFEQPRLGAAVPGAGRRADRAGIRPAGLHAGRRCFPRRCATPARRSPSTSPASWADRSRPMSRPGWPPTMACAAVGWYLSFTSVVTALALALLGLAGARHGKS